MAAAAPEPAHLQRYGRGPAVGGVVRLMIVVKLSAGNGRVYWCT